MSVGIMVGVALGAVIQPSGPALDLDFTSGALDSRLAFARGSAGTRFNSGGLLEAVASGQPRFTHDPVTLLPAGLLIEEARTNLLLNATIDGANLATQAPTVTAVPHTISFYGTGTITLSGAHVATVAGSGVYPARRTLTFTPTAGALTCTVTGTVQYAQLEVGSFATSFVPTAGATVSRALDNPVMAPAPITADEDFALLATVDLRQIAGPANFRVLAVSDGTNNNRINMQCTTTGNLTLNAVSAAANQPVGAAVAAGAAGKATAGAVRRGGRWDLIVKTAANVVTINNAATVGAFPVSLTQMTIGTLNGGSDALNGTVRRVTLHRGTFDDAQLSAFVAGL